MPRIYHRLESPTQSKRVALEQVLTNEIWGRTPRGGMVPVVQAYPHGLPEPQRGIEFTTPVDPYPNGSPFEVRWYLGKTPGVEHRVRHGEDFAAIAAAVVNLQL